MNIENKTIVVTGGGNGMGREMVLNLVKKGAKVISVDVNQKYLEETKKLAGGKGKNIFSYVLNITDHSKVKKFYDLVIKKHKNIDGLINNAGIIQPFVKVNKLKFNDIEKVMNVNFYGALYMIKTFLPHLLSRPEAHILNVSSMGGFLPVPGQSIYGASKAAVKLMTEGLYAELLDTNVGVTIAFPGAVATNITKNSGIDIPKTSDSSSFKSLPADKAAEIMINAIEKNLDRVHVGGDSKFIDRLYRLNPGYATRFIAKQMKSLLKD